jgi:recombination protein RecA
LDFEHAFSISRAKQLGLIDDKDKWLYKQPETAEEGFKIIDAIVNAVRKYDIDKHITVVIDSVASMMTKEELEAGYDESNMKTKLSLAALLSASLKKIANLINKANITLLLLNQVRDNPGIMFGDKEKTAGGRAIKFYCSTRIKLSKSGKIKDANDKIIGETIVAQITKNKVYEPFNVCEYISDFVDGINLELTHLKDLKEKGYFGDIKGWYEFGGKKYREKDLLDLMKNDKNFYNEILKLYFSDTPIKEATND